MKYVPMIAHNFVQQYDMVHKLMSCTVLDFHAHSKLEIVWNSAIIFAIPIPRFS